MSRKALLFELESLNWYIKLDLFVNVLVLDSVGTCLNARVCDCYVNIDFLISLNFRSPVNVFK